MASGFNDLSLSRSEQTKVKPSKGFGASAAVGTVVELSTNNQLGDSTIYLEMFNKKGSAGTVTKKTVKNFLKYAKKGLYNNSIFHRSVPGLFFRVVALLLQIDLLKKAVRLIPLILLKRLRMSLAI